MLAFELQSLSLAGRIWIGYAAIFVAVAAISCSADAHTEKHGYTKPHVNTELPNMPPDNWGGAKAHLAYSTVLGAAGQSMFPRRSLPVFGACLGVGVLHELHDRNQGQPGYKHGLFSRNDLKMNALGCGLGVLGVRGIQAYKDGKGFNVLYTREF
jgi:hypothetical protein